MQPEDAEALHRLGVSSYERGSFQEAVELITRAVALRPSDPKAYNDLGNALGALDRPAEAIAAFRQAIAIEPDYVEAHNNLGNAMSALDRPAEAEASYREALRLRPNVAEVHNNLGTVLSTLGRPAEAAASCREALRLRPQFPEAHSNLGNALRELGRPAEAVASCREALRLRPEFPEAYNNLGNALRELGRAATAEASYREALRLRPDYCEAHTNLGAALSDLGRPAEAAASCREALRLRPELPEAHNNLAHALLLAGRLEEGWKEHEWRWKTTHLSGDARGFAAPMWRGEPIGDRVILLHAEQGLGDTLQFCRYVPLLAAGARVILEVQAPLVRLLSRLPGITAIVARGDTLPSFDLHCPLMSLPLAFGTTLDTIPDRRRFKRAAMPRYLAAVLLAFVSVGTAGCDPMGLDTLTYTYGGTTYNSSAEALEAERRDNEAVLAAIRKRDSPIASTASILLPSEDRLFELTFAPRCVAYFCRSGSSVYEEKTYKAKSWHEDLLTTVRSVERSNLFGKVDVEEYDKIDRARINSAGDLVIAVHGTELGHEKGGWYLYTRRHPAGTYLPFDASIKPQSRRVDAWLNALEALVREDM